MSLADETFQWRIKARGVTVARFEMRAKPVADAIRVVTVGRLVGVARFFRTLDTQAVSILSASTGATRSSLLEFRGQGKFRRVSMRFDGDSIQTTGGDADESGSRLRRTIAGLPPLSSEAFALAVRGWRPSAGERAIAAVAGELNVWLIELEAQSPRMMSSALGPRRSQQLRGVARRVTAEGTLDPKTPKQQLSLWMSDDELRLPLRVTASVDGAKIVVDLTGHIQR